AAGSRSGTLAFKHAPAAERTRATTTGRPRGRPVGASANDVNLPNQRHVVDQQTLFPRATLEPIETFRHCYRADGRRHGPNSSWRIALMKYKLFVTSAAAALVAGTMFAAAQGPQKQAPGAGMGGQGQMQQEQGQRDQGKGPGEDKSQGEGKSTQGKGQTTGQGEKGKGQTTGQGEGKSQQQGKGQTTGQGEKGKGQTTGQGEGKSQQQGQQGKGQTTGQGEKGKGQTTGQGEGKSQQQSQQGKQEPGQQGTPQGGNREGQSAQPGAGGNVTFTAEQRTRIRETVIQSNNAPRVSNVNFSLSVGTVVPQTVRVVEVPVVLVEVHPQWRGFFYFIV